jgi:hypothetical protein
MSSRLTIQHESKSFCYKVASIYMSKSFKNNILLAVF